MKKVIIYQRTIKERTGYRKYPFKETTQYVIYNGTKNEIRNNHLEKIDNPRLRIPFEKVIETKSAKTLKEFASKLGRKDCEKWLKKQIEELVK